MTYCENLPDTIQGKSVDEIPELKNVLEVVSCDAKKWITIYKCKSCGQLWEERYEPTGHGEVSVLRKIK